MEGHRGQSWWQVCAVWCQTFWHVLVGLVLGGACVFRAFPISDSVWPTWLCLELVLVPIAGRWLTIHQRVYTLEPVQS